ncbi:VWA containing CoxE family protein [Nodularia spumigena CS-588/02]|uniref:VWA containing CoxE family protein n=1 Tax=Nodularia spumigena TaxID=70799 RepID=UPI00232B831E|nr:VWA containing CoxE family protein [Nodularia spumigena]MDB9361289.1 VWA containing CoxE family protein [Nodularia spumigena CS-588/02]MDB9363144.1 VWA containing CoxE family protein [Nodularia spumigena CS-588/02A10]
MSDFNPHPLLDPLFYRLRRDGFALGVSEYLVTLKAIDGGWGTEDANALKKLLKLLWCHSLAQQDQLEVVFRSISAEAAPKKEELRENNPDSSSESTPSSNPSPPSSEEQVSTVDSFPTPTPEFSLLPVKSPISLLEQQTEDRDFQTYAPISRRYMVYSWRYLRRMVGDGREDILDVAATIAQVCEQGFFLAPKYGRRERNHVDLLLLIDQEGSMTPFHHFTRDLVQTAQYESNIQQVRVGYFHNVPAKYIYRDPYLTEKVLLESTLAAGDGNTSILIVSDGGAARGDRRSQRFSATAEVLWQIKQHTKLIAWLNPIPPERWRGTTAQFIANLLPMYPLDPHGLNQAIAEIR